MSLSILWFVLIAILWTAYFVLEGFDFGVGMLLRVVGRSDAERSTTVRTIGPHWDGNEVWLITAGGAMFAAFPEWYATMFSGMYIPLFLILAALIVRIASIEWRSKLASATWRSRWDTAHTVAAFLVPFVFGVAFSNLVQGMKIEVVRARDGQVLPASEVNAQTLATASHQLTGGLWSLFTAYTLLGGVALLLVCLAHGSQFLSVKTRGDVAARATRLSAPLSLAATGVGAVWLLWGQFAYANNAYAWIPLLVAALALIASTAFSQPSMRSEQRAFLFSSVGILGVVAWIFSAMAPDVMKSSIAPSYSLTIAQASSTQPTLQVMTVVALVFVPVVLAYTIWSYWVFRARVDTSTVESNPGLPRAIRSGANFLRG